MDYTITQQYHEKKGFFIFVVRLADRLDKDDFTSLSELAKSHYGYYSSFRGVNGFVFKTEEHAGKFCEDMMRVLDSDSISTTKSLYNAITSDESSAPSISPASGMELHKALRAVIQKEGESIIGEVRLVNILDDYKVFSERKYLKNILRVLIQDNLISALPSSQWVKNVDKKIDRISKEYGWAKNVISFIFESLSYGLEYTDSVPRFREKDNVEIKSNKPAPSKTGNNSNVLHLKFKDIDITGDPHIFSHALTERGFNVGVWCDDFMTMEGYFAGVSNCKLWIHFEPRENMVYRVQVEFPWYQNRERVKKDYKKLKKSLQDLYGKPNCEHEDWLQDWSSTYIVPTGIIILTCFPGNCPQVTIDYYDGYYDNHHGEIIDDLAKIDL